MMVRLQIQVGPVGIEVGVQINQARRDVELAEVDHLLRVRRGDVLTHLVNLVADDRDVKTTVAFIVRIDHVPVLEQDVNDLLCSERRTGQTQHKPYGDDGTSDLSIHGLKLCT